MFNIWFRNPEKQTLFIFCFILYSKQKLNSFFSFSFKYSFIIIFSIPLFFPYHLFSLLSLIPFTFSHSFLFPVVSLFFLLVFFFLIFSLVFCFYLSSHSCLFNSLSNLTYSEIIVFTLITLTIYALLLNYKIFF